jgi:Coenzyme PQQ synthesis protein D (PqqD)
VPGTGLGECCTKRPETGEWPRLKGPITEASVVSSDEEVVSCDLAGGVALLDLRSGTYFSVNGVGACVWGLLREPMLVSDIHEALTARYDIEPGQCYADLVELLQELAGAGLIRVADGASG